MTALEKVIGKGKVAEGFGMMESCSLGTCNRDHISALLIRMLMQRRMVSFLVKHFISNLDNPYIRHYDEK